MVKSAGVQTKPNHEPQQTQLSDKNAKSFETMTETDVEAVRRGIGELRALIDGAMGQCIQVAGARASYHYTTKNGKDRDKQQDDRVKERASGRGADAVGNLRMYLNKIDEELRGVQKTIG